MANGVYTALDNDINYLAHHGVKNMKWYQHLYGVQQSLSKYAKGAQTSGVDPSILKKNAQLYGQAAKDAGAQGNKETAKYFKKAMRENYKDIENQAYNKRTRVSRALAGAAARVIGAGLKTASNVYKAGRHVQAYLRSSGYRKIVHNKIKRKAGKFVNSIREALGNVGKAIGTAAGKVRDRISTAAGNVRDRYNASVKPRISNALNPNLDKTGINAGRKRKKAREQAAARRYANQHMSYIDYTRQAN